MSARSGGVACLLDILAITPYTGAGPARLRQLRGDHVPGLLIAGIVFCTVLVAELPDNSGLASLVLGTRYRAGGVFAGAAAAVAVHGVPAVTCGRLRGLLPPRMGQIAVVVVLLAGAGLVLRGDNDDDEDEVRLKAAAAGFWAVAVTSFGVNLLAAPGDLSEIALADLAA